MLPARRRRTVVVLAGRKPTPELRSVLAAFAPGDSVLVAGEDDFLLDHPDATVVSARSLEELDPRLKRLGPIDILVDLRRGDADWHWQVFDRCFLQLRRGGAWVLPTRAVRGRESARLPRFAELASWVAGEARADQGTQMATLAAATATVAVGRRAVLVLKRADHVLKLADSETGILAEREPGIRFSVLERLEGTQHRADIAVISHHSEHPVEDFPVAFRVPTLEARRYDGRIAVAGRSLAYTGATALPESFRYPFAPHLSCPGLAEDHGDFARLPPSRRPSRRLPGAYFHVDVAYPGHYGHLLTEVVSRLWAWQAAKAAIPELKLVFRVPRRQNRDPVLERTLFTAYGIDPQDIVVTPDPVWVETLVGATPMWHNHAPHWAHPEIRDRVWKPMTDRLARGRSGRGSRLFVSRRGDTRHRPCRNVADVESFFADRGFAVVRPEDNALSDQAAMFRDAEVVAGFGGSGMFNVMHCRNLRRMIVLSHEAYTARNEQLYAAVLGSDIEYFWSPADLRHAGEWSDQAFKSGWEFDFARNSAALRATVADLG